MKQWTVSLTSFLFSLLSTSEFALASPQWQTELVDAICVGSRSVEIEFDRNSDVYLGYTGCNYESSEKERSQSPKASAVTGALKIAKRAGQNWLQETIDTASIDIGRHPNISFDPNNGLHVAYADHESWRMKYAYRAPGKNTFSVKEIGSEYGGYWVSGGMIADTFYGTHTIFSDAGYGSPRLELVTIKNGKVTNERIQNFDGGWNTFFTGNISSGPVIASMSGFAGFRGDLIITRLVNGKWVHDPIDSLTAKPEIVIDSNGFLHVTYTKQDLVDSTLDNVAYATNAPDGVWKSEIIAGDEDEKADAIFSTIAVDQNGGIHIAYKNYKERHLMYKRKLPGKTWETYTIDNRGNSIYSRLKVDAQNRLHIAYEKSENIFYGSCEGCTQE